MNWIFDPNYGAISIVDASVLEGVLNRFSNRLLRFLEVGVGHGGTSRGVKRFCDAKGIPLEYWGVDVQVLAPMAPQAKFLFRHEVCKLSGTFNVVFIDACHCILHTMQDIQYFTPMVSPGGYALFHDTAPLVQHKQEAASWCEYGLTCGVLDALQACHFAKYWTLLDDRYDPVEAEKGYGGMRVYQRQ